jgi:subtilisin
MVVPLHRRAETLFVVLTLVTLCVAGVTGVPLIVGYTDTASAASAVQYYAADQAELIDPTLHLVVLDVPESEIPTLRSSPGVTHLEYDLPLITAAEGPQDLSPRSDSDSAPIPFNLQLIHVDPTTAPWGIGTDVNVLLLDVGIDYTHPDLRRAYAGGFNFINKSADPLSFETHGTHCAGIIAGSKNTFMVGTKVSVVSGIAPGVRLYVGKILQPAADGRLIGQPSKLIKALHWARDNNMNIVSMSFGTQQHTWALDEAIRETARNNIILIAAAGNNESMPADYPARSPGVLAVGAVDRNGRPSSHSSKSHVGICAPGDWVMSTIPNGSYGVLSGTSVSAPHVTGVAALLVGRHPDWSASRVIHHLKNTATYLGKADSTGAGLVNAENALATAEL